jgi:hypothetical protein
LTQYLRRAAGRYPGCQLPRSRKLEELGRDGAPWTDKLPNGRWIVVDEAAADLALGLTSASSIQLAA